LTNNRRWVKNLRREGDVNLQKQSKNFEILVGIPAIIIETGSMNEDAIQSLVCVSEEEADKQSDRKAKASFRFCQVNTIFTILIQRSNYCFSF
jgi:hypothetical protein